MNETLLIWIINIMCLTLHEWLSHIEKNGSNLHLFLLRSWRLKYFSIEPCRVSGIQCKPAVENSVHEKNNEHHLQTKAKQNN